MVRSCNTEIIIQGPVWSHLHIPGGQARQGRRADLWVSESSLDSLRAILIVECNEPVLQAHTGGP